MKKTSGKTEAVKVAIENSEERDALNKEIATTVKKGRAIEITDEQTLAIAGKIIVELAGIIERGKTWWDRTIKPQEQALKESKAMRAEMLDPAESLRKALKDGANAYAQEQQRIADDLRRKAAIAEEEGRKRAQANAEKKAEEVPQGQRTFTGGAAKQGSTLDVEIVDKLALAKQLQKTGVLFDYIEFKMPQLRTMVRDNELTEFPGLKISRKASLSFGRA